MKKTLFCFLIILLSMHSCKSQNQSNHSQAVKLNNQAIELFVKNKTNRDSVNKAISLIDIAIKDDNLSYQSYNNKAKLLCVMGNYKEAIMSLDTSLKLNPNSLETKSLKGFILEKSGDTTSAKEVLRETIKDYESKINLDSNNVSLRLNRAFLFFFIDGSERAMKEFSIIKEKYPENSVVNNIGDIFIYFDKKSFLDSISE